jgi:xanthine dehydrogenase accessory factor
MMTTSQRFTARVAELAAERRRFVQATVVRAQCPTSTRPGDAAIVLPDGTIEGFVGGQCAESSVRTAALDALAREESVLLRILPEGSQEFPDAPGAITTVNPCLSGGAIEVFLEPKLPAARVVVVGQTPIAEALVGFGTPLGLAMDLAAGEDATVAGATAVIVASHGRAEESTIRAALDAGVGFVGLVASQVRGAAVLDELGLNPEERRVVRSPVGVDIGARTAEEIALSILADLVRAVRVEGLEPPKTHEPPRPVTAIDPVCGMTVTIADDTPHLHHDGTDHWFCNPGCRTRFADELGVGVRGTGS